ncbi:hypothetical protein [Pseudomonas sp. H9]|uniref:hypothetical protein n=1 Tax=Pseudomonas sp. H9 TaxID=483968 RepID=UPI0010580527|nr:hypothetical protein [Pseudomonas sp. H9]TDF85222.1 hypothetical protein E1573_06155 [Pseudomonas sp. H9]
MQNLICKQSAPLALMAAVAMSGCLPNSASEVQTVSSVVATSITAQELGAHTFTLVHRERNPQGYTIESGNLSLAGKAVDGSLVAVKGADGAVTAAIDRPGKRGLLLIDTSGQRRFLPEPAYDYLTPDTVPGPIEHAEQPPSAPGVVREVDAVVQLSVEALRVLNSDPVAFALVQLETANLSLRNSQVASVRLNLAGTRVGVNDYAVIGENLSELDAELAPLHPVYHHDLNVGFSENSPMVGVAEVRGNTSLNSIYSISAFRHEVGHNAGGSHCNEDGSDNYRFGYNDGKDIATALCHNDVPYYSNPHVSLNGKPVGDARTADMARVWREEAGRLSGYGPTFNGDRLIFGGVGQAQLLISEPGIHKPSLGVVALSEEVGPTSLVYGGPGDTVLSIKLTENQSGNEQVVKFRAHRQVQDCPDITTMNSYVVCHPDSAGPITLTLFRIAQDNPSLPLGVYNGVVELKALDYTNPEWSRPILVSVTVWNLN